MRSLSPETAVRFLQACEGDKYGLIFEFALVTGMRPEEYLGLRWCDVDFAGNKVKVQQVLVRNRKGGGWSFCPPKTPKSRRTIPIPGYLKIQLAEAKMSQNAARMEATGWQDFDLVFASEIGTPLSLRNLQRRHFKPILKAAGLGDMTTYELRHSCATLLLSADENPKVVAERLGHSSIVLTLDTYSHVLPTMQQGATDKLERILRKR
jgi:integrase